MNTASRMLMLLVEVDAVRVLGDAVADEMIKPARDVELHAVRQMSAVREVEAEHGVARLEDGEIHGHVGLAAGVGLDIGELRAEELFRAVAGEVLDDIDVLAATDPRRRTREAYRYCRLG